MHILHGQKITTTNDDGDGLCLSGPESYVVEDCVVNFSALPLEGLGLAYTDSLDECLTTMKGANVTVKNSVFTGSGKCALCGNGDHPEVDAHSIVTFENCVFENCGRRMPEAQDGVKVLLKDCVIRNWGIKDRFCVRAFGAWAHHGASIVCVRCRFEQTSFWQTGVKNFFIDLVNHLGQAINDRGVLGLHLNDFIPGVCRGLIATDGGGVASVNCTKNKWWIYLG